MIVRSATTGDLLDVASWVESRRDAELWAGWRVTFPLDAEQLPAQIELTATNAFCLVDGGRTVAFAQLVEKAARRGHLARLIVDPRERQKGYGRALVERLIDVARARRLAPLSLNVDAVNPAAIALYTRLGFSDAARPPDEPHAPDVRYLELPL